ncbi:phosphonate ABC transporter, permease protein PhnE [Martelella mediterranea]|uniref:Phosphonate transport system permease protein n=1 Tax=Martelella mediterranea TaxID=293089 RepID=A0A4R3NXU9_9HYPH|nr:phosphonate ABC transporter, permease protein PhnE [Martelella mediterranea]TCT44976.1 phosphonate transport system permease protein [Martelella mediterranea]
MSVIDASEMEAIAARHPELMHGSMKSRIRSLSLVAGAVLYLAFCWWFFSVGAVLGSANWAIAGNYLADWVSWEARPTIEIEADGAMSIKYPRFSPLGENPDPAWLTSTSETMTRTIETGGSSSAPSTSSSSSGSFMFVAPENAGAQGDPAADTGPTTETVTENVVTSANIVIGKRKIVEVLPESVRVTRGKETVTLALVHDDGVYPESDLPAWLEQARPGAKVYAWFGFDGYVEIRDDKIIVHKRFLGWENFFFDTNSDYFGMTFGQVVSHLFSSERLDPAMSNWKLAANDFLYNPSWQHLDVWTKLLQTIVMAFVGTLFAGILAFPLSFIAARNITRNKPVNQLTKRFFDFLRSVDMFIWALFFTRAFGPGPLAGISAIFFTDTGTLGKLYSEALENIDDKQREGVKSVGAPPLAVQRFGVLPQVLPVFCSQALYFWESNTRSATIIGAVGAGGIGLKLWESMRTNSDWENVAYMVVLILLVVFLFDHISNALRSRLMGTHNADRH